MYTTLKLIKVNSQRSFLYPVKNPQTWVAFKPIFIAWQTSQYDVIKSTWNIEIQAVDPLAKSKDDGSPNFISPGERQFWKKREQWITSQP